MKTNPPPLHLLMTLEAVVRLRSFKEAAAELHITPSAVSHRIRSLETRIGQALFDRSAQQVVASPAAERLATAVTEATKKIVQIWEDIQTEGGERFIRMSCLPAFGARYVLPYLNEFLGRHPNFKLNLSSASQLSELENGTLDAVIYYGKNPGSRFFFEFLKPSIMVPVVARSLYGRVFRHGELVGPFLDFGDPSYSWSDVSSSLDYKITPTAETIKCESVMAACEAVEAGVGIGLLPEWVAKQAIERGTVVALAERPIETNRSYWFVTRRGEETYPYNQDFNHWLQMKIKKLDHK